MELATQLVARGLLNTLAVLPANGVHTGFDPKLRVATSFATLPFVALPSPLGIGPACQTKIGRLNARRALAPLPSARSRAKAAALRCIVP